MKFIKIGLYIFGGLILIGMAGAGVFIATFDANDYKPQISEQVKQHTGRDFTLADIKPAVFPWLGIELQQLSLGNASGFKAKQMLQIERLDVRVAIWPLLSGEVRIDTLRIHGLQLSLSKDVQGKTNWDDILQKQQSSATQAAVEPSKASGSKAESEASLVALMVNGIEIKDASVLWDDATTKQSVALQKLNLDTGAIRVGEQFPVKLNTHIELSEPQASLDFALQTRVDFNPESQRLKLDSLNLTIDAALQQMGIKLAQISLNTQLNADLARQTFKLPSITLDINANGEAIPGGKIKAEIKSAADINLKKQTASIKQLSVNTMDISMQSEIAITNLIDSPNAKGQFKLLSFNPTKLLKQLAIDLPEMQSKDVMKSSAVSFEFTGNETALNLKKLLIQLDKTSIKGALGLTQFDKPAVKYQLALDKINLDDYLPPPAPPQKPNPADEAKTTKAPADTPIDLPVAMLRELNINGSFKAKTIQAFEQTISSLNTETVAKRGLIKLPVIKAKLLDGSVSSSAQLDVRKSTPRYKMSLKGKGLEADSVVSPILQDILGEKKARLTGASSLDMDINSKGQSVKQLMANSNGQFKFNMGKAQLHEVDIEFYVRQAVVAYMEEKKIAVKDRLRGEYKPKQTTALKVVRASATIKNGLVENKDLLVDSSKFKVTGAGRVSLGKETINYRAVVDLKPDSRKSVAQRLLDEPLPVHIKGSFSLPKYDIKTSGWTKVLKSEAKQAVKKKVDKKLDKKVDKLKDKYKDKLKGLFR